MATRFRQTPSATGAKEKARLRELGDLAETFSHWRGRLDGRGTFVYLISEWDVETETPTGLAKIGRAGDPVARLNGLRTGNPRHLQLDGLIVGSDAVERALHYRWRHVRVGWSEWFESFAFLDQAFREIDRRQRALVAPLLKDLDAVVDQVNRIDLVTGEPTVDTYVTCVKAYDCACDDCEMERRRRVRHGVRPRCPIPIKTS